MDKLIEALNSIWENPVCFDKEDSGYFDYTNPEVDEASGLACDILITDNGQPDQYKITQLEASSVYYVTPGEQDSFGWLTGAIHKKGSIRTLYFG